METENTGEEGGGKGERQGHDNVRSRNRPGPLPIVAQAAGEAKREEGLGKVGKS